MILRRPPAAPRIAARLAMAAAPAPQAAWDDARLVEAAREGDAAAFGWLFERYGERLCHGLVHVCGSLADAQDAAQEAFLRAHQKLRTYRCTSSFYTWLYRIAVNVVITGRRRKRERLLDDPVGQQPALEPLDRAEAPEERLERQERTAQIQEALASLSGHYREVLLLREVDDHDYDEIARLLHLPVGTVRSRLHRARLQMREKLTLMMR